MESEAHNQTKDGSGFESSLGSSSSFRGYERQHIQEEGETTIYQISTQDINRLSTLNATSDNRTQSEVNINIPFDSPAEAYDSSEDIGIVMIPRNPSRNSMRRTTLYKTREEEQGDIERCSGFISKTASQNISNGQDGFGNSSTDGHQRYASYNDDLEQGDRLQPDDKPIASSQELDSGVPSPSPGIFRFGSIKSSIFNRLFGSQPISAGESSSSFQNASSKGKNIVSFDNSAMHIDPAGIHVTRHPSHGEQAENLTRNIATNRILPARSGGILSNLLKLQALSMPPPKRDRRRRRSSSNNRNRPKKMRSRNASFASDILSVNSDRNMISSRKSSVISLPGLLMTAPIGVGLRSNSISPSTAVQSPASSTTVLNAPMTDNALRTSSSAGYLDGLKQANSEYPNNSSSKLHKEATLSPERPCGSSGSSKYLQTHSGCSTRSSVSADDGTSTYYSVSHDPILAAIRLNQQIELTEAMADILQRQELLIRLCKSFIRYGAPSHRIEHAMDAMCRTFEVDGSFAFLPGLMMISFGDTDTHTSETHLIKCAQGFEMGRLAKVHRIARALVNGEMEPSEGLVTLKAINNQKPLYNNWIMLSAFAMLSGVVAPLVFKGSWYDMIAGMGLGIICGLSTIMASHYSTYSNVFEVSTSILIAFVAKALRDYVCFTGVVLSAIVMLLPGLSLTTAIMELSSRYMISGSVRMFYSLMYCLFLGFGISIGSNLWDAIREPLPGDLNMGYCNPATEPWRWVLFPLLGISIGITLHASPRQWPMVVICSSVGFAVSELAGTYWPSSAHIAASVSAFAVGLLGNIYERVTHEL
ncbi:hypothetical protein BGZ49_009643, partial [Haplosporangium sp. Z 27]